MIKRSEVVDYIVSKKTFADDALTKAKEVSDRTDEAEKTLMGLNFDVIMIEDNIEELKKLIEAKEQKIIKARKTVMLMHDKATKAFDLAYRAKEKADALDDEFDEVDRILPMVIDRLECMGLPDAKDQVREELLRKKDALYRKIQNDDLKDLF